MKLPKSEECVVEKEAADVARIIANKLVFGRQPPPTPSASSPYNEMWSTILRAPESAIEYVFERLWRMNVDLPLRPRNEVHLPRCAIIAACIQLWLKFVRPTTPIDEDIDAINESRHIGSGNEISPEYFVVTFPNCETWVIHEGLISTISLHRSRRRWSDEEFSEILDEYVRPYSVALGNRLRNTFAEIEPEIEKFKAIKPYVSVVTKNPTLQLRHMMNDAQTYGDYVDLVGWIKRELISAYGTEIDSEVNNMRLHSLTYWEPMNLT